jgi:hypothetical protein
MRNNNITFCINTAKNEINHIKLLFRSLELNLSRKDYEILVFVNGGKYTRETFEWLSTKKSTLPGLKILRNKFDVGFEYARNINEMFKLASNEIVSYLHSDMVVCKNYDLEVLKHLEKNMILSSTRIEPPLHGNSGEKFTYDFGVDPTKFDLEAFTQYAESKKQDKITDYFFAPFTLYKDTWNSIGGHDTLFRRSREDSDILTRLVLNGTSIKQTWSAIAYHFTCTSSRGLNWFDVNNKEAQLRVKIQQQADRIEIAKFIRKWGSFSHSTDKVRFYRISAEIIGNINNIDLFLAIEPFFNKIYMEDSITAINLYNNMINESQIPANELLGYDKSSWEEFGYLCNMESTDKIAPIKESYCDDILVKFDINNLTQSDIMDFIYQIQEIIGTIEDPGVYEFGPFTITTNSLIDRASDNIIIKNPEVKKEHMYEIY